MVPVCNICDSNEKTKVYDTLNNLYWCADCNHTFTLIDEKYYEKNIYSEDYFDSAHKNWFKYPNYPLFQYIHKFILAQTKRHDFKLVDVGCGRGDWLSYLHKVEPGADLTGIDGAPCSSNDFKFIQDDFMKMEINGKFGIVTSLACIEHVADPDLFVKKLKKMVLPEGLVVIMTINSGGMLYGLAKILNKMGISSSYNRLYSDHHIHHFTNQSLRMLLEKHDFRIISQKNHNIRFKSVDYPPASFVMTLLYKISTATIFFLSTIFQNGYSQTVICVPNKNSV